MSNINKSNSNINENLNINNKFKDSDFLKRKKMEIEGSTHFNFFNRPYTNCKQIVKNNNRNKIIIPKLNLDMNKSEIYKRRIKKK